MASTRSHITNGVLLFWATTACSPRAGTWTKGTEILSTAADMACSRIRASEPTKSRSEAQGRLDAKQDSFLPEQEIYARLQHQLGYTIPIHYRTAKIEHPGQLEKRKAHLIELVNGIPLSECTMEQSIEYRSKAKIDEALALLTEMDVVQGDPALRQCLHTAKGDLTIIDFGDDYTEENCVHRLNQGDAKNAMFWFSLKFATQYFQEQNSNLR